MALVLLQLGLHVCVCMCVNEREKESERKLCVISGDACSLLRSYLDLEVALTPDQMNSYIEKLQLYVNSSLVELRRLFLVQDLLDSIKVRY